MNIRKQTKQYALYRYGGAANGKNIEVRIGAVAIGTKPDSIPEEIVQDLTPRELASLQEVLRQDLHARIQERVCSLQSELNDLADAMEAGLLDDEVITKLTNAVKQLLKAKPKNRRQAGTVPHGSAQSPTPIQES